MITASAETLNELDDAFASMYLFEADSSSESDDFPDEIPDNNPDDEMIDSTNFVGLISSPIYYLGVSGDGLMDGLLGFEDDLAEDRQVFLWTSLMDRWDTPEDMMRN